jgi:hypothetical protein
MKGTGFTGCGKTRLWPVLYQGTTSVVPQMQQKKGWALAPAAFLHYKRQYFGIFPQPVQPVHFSAQDLSGFSPRGIVFFGVCL